MEIVKMLKTDEATFEREVVDVDKRLYDIAETLCKESDLLTDCKTDGIDDMIVLEDGSLGYHIISRKDGGKRCKSYFIKITDTTFYV